MRNIVKAVILLLIPAIAGTHTVWGQKTGMPGPHIIVYKTRANYRNLVPVGLSADKTHIISYPGPQDLKAGDEYMLPVVLHKGYLLDKKGIGENTAFLKMTYQQFAARKDAPSLDEMYKMIVDKKPFTEYYDCGPRYKFPDVVKQINKLIEHRQLKSECKLLK